MSPTKRRSATREETEALIAGMAREIWDGRRADSPFYLVGVRTRGVPLAQRLAQDLAACSPATRSPVGAVDITLYRDDLGQGRRWPVLTGHRDPVRRRRCRDRAGRRRPVHRPDRPRGARTRSATWAGRRGSAWPCWSTAATASSRSSPTSSACTWRPIARDRVRVRLHPLDPDRGNRPRPGRSRLSPARQEPRAVTIASPPSPSPAPSHADARPRDRPIRPGPASTCSASRTSRPRRSSAILDTAESFAEISTRSRKKVPALQGRIVFNLFFENSTRTRTSFSLAAKRLSADTQDFSASGSSLSKGETFIDTAKNIEAMGVDVDGGPPPDARRAAPAGPARQGARSSTPATAPTSTRRRGCSTS